MKNDVKKIIVYAVEENTTESFANRSYCNEIFFRKEDAQSFAKGKGFYGSDGTVVKFILSVSKNGLRFEEVGEL